MRKAICSLIFILFLPCLGLSGDIFGTKLLPENFRLIFSEFTETLSRFGFNDDARLKLDHLLGEMVDQDIKNIPAISIALLQLAEKSEKLRPEERNMLVYYSELFSPELAEISFASARFYLSFGTGNFSFHRALEGYRKGVLLLKDDIVARARLIAVFSWWCSLFSFILFGSFGLVIFVRYLRVFMHRFQHFFPKDFLPKWMIISLGVCVLLLPLFFGARLWLLCAWWVVVFSPFAMNLERGFGVITLVLLCVGFLLVPNYVRGLSLIEHKLLVSTLRIENGLFYDEDLFSIEQEVSRGNTSLPLILACARAEQRLGNYQSAIDFYKKALQQGNLLEVVYSELGSFYMHTSYNDEALKMFEQALSIAPEKAEILYSLSQVYYAKREFDKSESFYNQARITNFDEITRFDQLKQRSIKGFFIPRLRLPFTLYWEMNNEASDLKREEGQIARTWFGFSSVGTPLIFALIAILMLVSLSIFLRDYDQVRVCRYCGSIICLSCFPGSREPLICSPCYQIFRIDRGVDPRLRLEQKGKVRRYQQLVGVSGLFLNIFVPGVGFLIRGELGRGICFLVLSSLFLARVLFQGGFPFPIVSGVESSFGPWFLIWIVGYLLLVLVSFLIYFKKGLSEV